MKIGRELSLSKTRERSSDTCTDEMKKIHRWGSPRCPTECDVPVPGNPVPGNSSFFVMVSEPELKKFGTEKISEPELKKIWYWKSLGTGIENFWYRKKSRNRSRKKWVPKKSLGIGLEKFWYRKKSRNRSRKNLVPKKSLGIGIVQILGLVTHW